MARNRNGRQSTMSPIFPGWTRESTLAFERSDRVGGRDAAGTWYTGVLQMQIATALLSTSVTSMANFGLAWARYVFAVALLAVGLSNLMEVCEWKKSI